MSKWLWIVLVVWTGVLAAVGAGVANAQQPDRVRLALNWKPEPQFGGFYAAELGGHFAAGRLNVELLPGGSGTPTVQMVDNRRAEFGIVSADELVKLRARGGDVVALYAVFQTNPQGILTHAARNFSSLKELLESPGTIAWQAGLPYVTHLRRNYDLSRLRQVPYTGGLPFLGGPDFAQQCFVISEPILARQQGHAVQTFLIAESGYNPYTTVLIARGDTVRNNPDLIRRMVAAVQAGWQSYLEDPGPANDAMRRLNPAMDARTFDESAEAQKPLIQTEETARLGLGAMTAERWETLIRQLREYREIDREVPAAECFRWTPPPGSPPPAPPPAP